MSIWDMDSELIQHYFHVNNNADFIHTNCEIGQSEIFNVGDRVIA